MKLRRIAYTAQGATIRLHAAWILLAHDGVPVSRIAAFSGVSRPTVYRFLKIWTVWRDPEALRSAGSGRFVTNRPAGGEWR